VRPSVPAPTDPNRSPCDPEASDMSDAPRFDAETPSRGRPTVTTTIDRGEISKRNGSRSQGPKSPEGKARSRFNALKHDCRANLPILPGEDPEEHRRRHDDWVEKFVPRDAVELFLVERAVHVSWQLERADRAAVARLAAEVEREAAERAE